MASSIVITIADVDHTTKISDLSWKPGLNGVGTASFLLTDDAGAIIPSEGQAVVITVGGTAVWAGEISEATTGYAGLLSGVATRCTCEDYNVLPSREPFNGTIPSQTVAATLAWLCGSGGPLESFSVTVHGSQVPGPTLPAIACDFWYVDRILAELGRLSGLSCWRINASLQLRLWAPGEIASGQSFTHANENVIDAYWTRHRLDYRNIQLVIYGPTDTLAISETFTGDGSARTFPFRYRLGALPATVTIDPAGTVKPVGLTGGSEAPEWNVDTSLGLYGGLRQGVSFTPLSGSETVTSVRNAPFPNYTGYVDDAEVDDRGRWVGVESLPEVTDVATADTFAEARVRENKAIVKKPTILSDIIVEIGATAVVDLPIGLSGETMLITEASFQGIKANDQLDVEATYIGFTGSERQASAADVWRRILSGQSAGRIGGGSSGGGGFGGGGGGGGGVTSGPVIVHFGGWKQVNAPTWRSTAGDGGAFDLPEGAEYFLVGANIGGLVTLSIHLKTDGGANGAVSARLYNETDAVAASDWTTGITAGSLTYVSVTCALASAIKVYKVQLRVSGSAHATSNISYWNATLWNA